MNYIVDIVLMSITSIKSINFVSKVQFLPAEYTNQIKRNVKNVIINII